MGVKIKKRGSKWYVYVNYHGQRKNRCVGTREAAEKVRRELEARLALGDTTFLSESKAQLPNFQVYAERWLAYVRDQMGHSSIQITVDTYGHLTPGADIAWVDRLDAETTPHQSAPETHQPGNKPEAESVEVVENT